MNQKLAIGIGGVLVAGAAFAAGWFAYGMLGGGATAGPGGANGPFGQLSQSERQQLQSMSDEERQQFFKDKGIEMPSGGPGGEGAQRADGAPGAGPGGGVMQLEGTVAKVDADKLTLTLTAGGSANVYVATSTVVAAVDGGEATVAQGSSVIVTAKPEADGVTAADTIIVK